MKSENKEALPIIFVHKGDSFYLKYALESAKKFNPKSRIILIGDNVTIYPNFVEYYEMNKFNEYGKVLEKIYVHLNTSNPEIEMFCIKRWLVLLDFMEKQKLKKVFTCDSDVLLFQDVTEDAKHYKKFDFLLANGVSAGLTFINNLNILKKYNLIVLDFYKNKIFKQSNKFNNSISDMSFWVWLNEKNIFKIGDIIKTINNSVYDAGVLIKQNNSRMVGSMKKIIFINKIPYLVSNKENIRLKCIHFQAGTKFYMKYFSKGKFNFLNKLKVDIMIFLRDNFSSKLNKNQLIKIKKLMISLGF